MKRIGGEMASKPAVPKQRKRVRRVLRSTRHSRTLHKGGRAERPMIRAASVRDGRWTRMRMLLVKEDSAKAWARVTSC